MYKNVSSPLGTAPIGKLMLKLALPTVVAQIVNLLYNIVDRIYIGHIEGVGADALTGVGLCLPMIMMMNAFAMLGASGGAPRAAIALGQGRKDEAEKILGNCSTMLLIFSAMITVAFLLFAEPLLRLFGASDATLPYALAYMNIYSCGSVFVLLVLGLNTFLTAQGFSNFAMITTLIGAIINLILDPVLIFGFGMGVEGAAIATVISQAVGSLWVLWFLVKGKKTILRLRLASMSLIGRVVGPCLALGVSADIGKDFQFRSGPCGAYHLDHAGIYGGHFCHGLPDNLSAVFYGPGPGEGELAAGLSAETDSADPAHLYFAPVYG